jgi:hypothetical protein
MIVALGALLGMFGGVVTATPALAGGRGDGWQVTPADPFTLPAAFCGFEVFVDFPVHREYTKLLKTPNGSEVTLTTGSLTASFTANGKTITENISGPYTMSSTVWAFKGRTAFALTPAQAKQFELPIFFVTDGALTISFDSVGNPASVSLQGRVVVDICAALS